MKVLLGKLIDDSHTFAILVLLHFLGGKFLFLHDDAVFVGNIFEGFGIGHILVAHHKRDRRTRHAAAKAFEDVFGRRHGERRRFLVVEWAAADVIRAAPFERHKVLHHVEYLRRIDDSLYCLFVNHFF